MHSIMMFLENQHPFHDNAEVERIAQKSKLYHIIDGILFCRGTNDMMMKCMEREEGIHLLCIIHSGICIFHSS
jgi:hypothetical protein